MHPNPVFYTIFSSHKFFNFWKVFALSHVGLLIGPVRSETSSLLNGATITASTGLDPGCNAIDDLISNKYKSLSISDGGLGPYNDFSFWFKIDLGAAKSIKTVFIVNRIDYPWNRRMGSNYICIGNNPADPLAIGNICTTIPFFDGGFIPVSLPPGQ